ncbi:MAG: CpaD family pilus assembly lipoprotein [Holosporaceae bacterium]|jgi:type IV pilus biogenesis protein CpaD/CtpE|nr:CpaD family pilus assembly lipoprotein [Holosporaceae bacterium]
MIKVGRLINLMLMALILLGCEKQYLADDGYVPEITKIDTKETRKVYFFKSSADFDLHHDIIANIEKLLKNIRSKGIENIGFLLVSNKPISMDIQKKVKKQIRQLICKHGFIDSRIMDFGACIYQNARVGIRIDALKYDVKKIDCSIWSEYIGDTDTNKHLPKCGASIAYNLSEMIVNKADFVMPRKYKGPDAKSAIASLNKASSGSSSGSSSSGSSSSGSSSSSGT